MEKWNIRKGQAIIFVIGWIAYASTYFLRKPLGVVSVLADDDDELMLNVLGCHLTYQGQVVTNAEARFNKIHIRKVYACFQL